MVPQLSAILIAIAVAYKFKLVSLTHSSSSNGHIGLSCIYIAVSYTHLDVYKRQHKGGDELSVIHFCSYTFGHLKS